MKTKILLIILLVTNYQLLFSQGVAINTSGATADQSAGLDIQFNDKGLLMPRLSIAERNAISNPASGLQIYNTTINCFEFYNGTAWKILSCGCDLPSTIVESTHIPSQTEIVWNWNIVTDATGYKYNTINDYYSATDNGNKTTFTQSGLTCNTTYNLFVWAYNNCGKSSELVLIENTDICFTCGVNNFFDSRDGQTYQTVQIGSQCWMKENLKYLPVVHNNSEFATQATNSLSGYGVYNYNGNDILIAKANSNYSTYGVLYNWHAAITACPAGWYLPSDDEWKVLEMHLGMSFLDANNIGWRGTDQGNNLKSTTLWLGGSGNNSSGFSALPSGSRNISGIFSSLNTDCNHWTVSDDGADAWLRALYSNYSTIGRGKDSKGNGYAIRCIKH